MFGVSDRARALVGFSLMVIWTGRTFGGETQPAPQPPPARIPTYTFTPIGTLPGYERAFVNDINNAGQVVGTAWRVVFGPDPVAESRAFIFENGVLSDIGTSEFHSGAEGINDFGHIVGFDRDAQNSQIAFLLDDDGYHELFHCCTAGAINNAGQVLIRAGTAYLWENGSLTSLSPIMTTQPNRVSINNQGQVVGTIPGPWIPTPPFHESRGVVWENGVMTELPLLGPGPSTASLINDLGEIVGSSGGTITIWRNGTVEDLRAAPYYLQSSASAFNNHGFIVGGLDPPGPTPLFATVWRPGETLDLNRLVPPGTTFKLEHAKAINDFGDIAGEGRPAETPFWQRAFLLHPIDCDSNEDGEVNLSDHANYLSCLTGPRVVPSLECAPIDFDRDGDVDFVDYRSLELAFEP